MVGNKLNRGMVEQGGRKGKKVGGKQEREDVSGWEGGRLEQEEGKLSESNNGK